MLDLDGYINNSVKVKIFGEELEILEPSVQMIMQVDKIESEEKKDEKVAVLEIAELFLNHNRQERKFTKEGLKKLPYEALYHLNLEVSTLRYKAEEDPN